MALCRNIVQTVKCKSSLITQNPNVIFYSLTNAGASAIIPILTELLPEQLGYKVFGHPANSERYEQEFSEHQPIFHWTHSPKTMFKSFLYRKDFRFICLYRDPRDVLLSHVKCRFHDGDIDSKLVTEKQVLLQYIHSNFDNMFDVADEWLHSDPKNVLALSFEELKKSVPLASRKILSFLGLSLSKSVIADVCQRHSFESTTKRKRGQHGPILRNSYMYRKGIVGDWINHYDPEVKAEFNIQFGRILKRWGYKIINSEPHPEWDHYRPRKQTHHTKCKIINPTNATFKPNAVDTTPQEFQIVSAPMPSGITWLVNVLLELGIKTSHQGLNNGDNHWKTADNNEHQIIPTVREHLKWHLPILRNKDTFKFEDNLEVRWEHRLDFASKPIPTILFTRDGRDAVYSQYCRHYEDKLSFDEFLKRQDIWPHHFPDMFGLPAAETWALFNLYWLEMAKITPHRVVRFEDTKTNPLKAIQEVLQFLGVQRSRADMLDAIEASSSKKFKEQERLAAQNSGEALRGNNRKGKPYEWKEHYNETQIRAFEGLANEALYKLGYEPVEPFEEGSQQSSITIEKDIDIQDAIKMRDLSKVFHLIENKAAAMDDLSLVFELLAERKALQWTYYIFKEDFWLSAAAAISQCVFTRVLKNNISSEYIQCLLTNRSIKDQEVHYYDFENKGIHFVTTKEFLYKYRGYSLFQFGRELLAISPSVEKNHDINNYEIILLQKEGKCFVHSDEKNLKTVLDDFLNTILKDANKLVKRNLMREAITVIKKGVYLTGAKDKAILDFVDQLMEAKD
jgi:hypothetical protein